MADRAGALWDELSMYFPMAHGRDLDEPHALAELLHQILLQGIADLELVHTKAHQLRAMIRTEAEGLVEEFAGTSSSSRCRVPSRFVSPCAEAGTSPGRSG